MELASTWLNPLRKTAINLTPTERSEQHSMAPQVIFGTASFGMDLTDFQDADSVKGLLSTLRDLGIQRLDTGARYPPLNPGKSETLIGEAKALSLNLVVDTKVYTNTQTDGSGDLTQEAMQRSVEGSLQRLQRQEGVNVLYAHRADPATPLEDQIQAFDEQIAQGHCKAVSCFQSSIP